MNKLKTFWFAIALQIVCAMAAPLLTKAATITWTNAAGGNWNVPANWKPNQVPGAADTALITTAGSYGVSVTDGESVSNLVLGAASGTLTLSISATFTVNGTGSDSAQSALVISGGALTGTGSIVAGGPLTWSGGSIYNTVYFNGGTQNNGMNLYGGTLVNSGAFAWNGQLYFYPGSQFTNLVSGTVTFAAGAQANAEGGGANNLDNEGQFNVVGTGSPYVSIPFNNHGTVTITNGTLQLSGGGTETGLFTNTVGGTLNLGGGTFTFTANSSVVGAGNFTVSGGTANLGGSMNVAGTYTVSGGTANVTGACTITNTLIVSSGALNLNGTGTNTPVSFTMSGGTVAGSQPVQVLGSGGFNWSGGAIYNTVLFNGGTENNGLNLYGGTLVNSGAFAWNGQIFFYPGSQLTNRVSGTLTFAAGAQANAEGGGINNLDNEGQFNVVGPGTAYVTTPFINHGAVTVSNVTFQLSGGGTETGIFTNAVGGTLNLNGGTFTFTANSSIVGAGIFQVSGGTANLGGFWGVTGTNLFSGGMANITGTCNITNVILVTGGTANFNGSGALTPSSLSMNGGVLEGTQLVMVNGPFNLSGGSVGGVYAGFQPGALVQCIGGSISGSGYNMFSTEIINVGTMAWTANPIFMYGNTLVTNVVGATINATNAQWLDYGSPTLGNAGQFNVWSGSSANVPFFNSGTVNINSGTLSLTGGASLNNGTLNFSLVSPASFGALTLAGHASLTGTIGVTFNGYTPQVGDTFPLITYGSESGAFTGFNLPSGINWQQTYGSTTYKLSVGLPLNFALAVGQPAWTASGFNLAISGPVGSNYTVFVTTNLAQNNWSPLTNFVSVFTSTPITDTGATKFGTNRFYRLYLH